MSENNNIPKSIITALTRHQDRPFILYLEKDLIKFIKNSILGNIKQPEYVIQAQYLKNSYYRLLSHQLCQYYHLQHWNNQQSEIVVTPIPDYDYQSFKELLDEDNESSDFVKVADVASQYQAEHSPPSSPTHASNHYSRGNNYHSHNQNYNQNQNQNHTSNHNHHSMNKPQHYQQQRAFSPRYHSQYNNPYHLQQMNYNVYSPINNHAFNPLRGPRPQNLSSEGLLDNLNNNDNSNNSTSTSTSITTNTKPKFIVKKIINKPSPQAPSEETKDDGVKSLSESLSNLNVDVSATELPGSAESESTSASETTKSTIESQRASKEALYRKLREEIFLKEDEDQNDDDDEEEEDDDDEEEEEEEEANDEGEDLEVERKENVDESKNGGTMSPSEIHEKTENFSKSKHQRHDGNYRAQYRPRQPPYNRQQLQTNIASQSMGYGFYQNQHHVQMQIPMQAPYQQIIAPNGMPGLVPQTPGGAVPVFFNPYFAAQQPMVSQAYGYPAGYLNIPPHSQLPPIPQPPPPYDKETERRLLNNPYIIIPGDERQLNGKTGKPQRGKRMPLNYKSRNSSGTLVNQNGHAKGSNQHL